MLIMLYNDIFCRFYDMPNMAADLIGTYSFLAQALVAVSTGELEILCWTVDLIVYNANKKRSSLQLKLFYFSTL